MHTQAQKDLLREDTHFHTLDTLSDGDLFIVDLVPQLVGLPGMPDIIAVPYILTIDGNVHEISYHYRYYHGRRIPAYQDKRCPPSLHGPFSSLTRSAGSLHKIPARKGNDKMRAQTQDEIFKSLLAMRKNIEEETNEPLHDHDNAILADVATALGLSKEQIDQLADGPGPVIRLKRTGQ